MVTLKFKLTEEEYFDFSYYTAWAAPWKKSYRLKYFLKVFILYGGVAGLYMFTNHTHILWVDMTVFFLIGSIYFLLIPYFIRRSIKRRVRELLSQPANQHVLDEAEVILMDSGIIDRDKNSESKYDWEAIVQKTETKTSYFLYTNSYHAIVIPKRVVYETGQQQEIARLFNNRLSLSAELIHI